MPPIRSAPLWAITRLPLQRSDVSFPQVRTWSAAARRIHPVLNSIPMLDEDSIVRLAVSISIDGMMEPITLDHTGYGVCPGHSVHQVRAFDVLSAVRHGGAPPAAKATTAATDAALQGVRPALPAPAPA
jgi:hypothetical protein